MYKYLSVFLAVAFLSLVGSSTASAWFPLTKNPEVAAMCSDPNFYFVTDNGQETIKDESPAKGLYCRTVATNKKLWGVK